MNLLCKGGKSTIVKNEFNQARSYASLAVYLNSSSFWIVTQCRCPETSVLNQPTLRNNLEDEKFLEVLFYTVVTFSSDVCA